VHCLLWLDVPSVYWKCMRRASILLIIMLAGCVDSLPTHRSASRTPSSIAVTDNTRHRVVPILVYGMPRSGTVRPLAILSHGYGVSNSEYSFVADHLVKRGYLVVSIDHVERAGDPPMVNSGKLSETRRPVWQVGADSIGFIIGEMSRRGLSDPRRRAVLVGHSNGGDMTMLFASQHPELVDVAFSLDNRRMPLPRSSSPRVCSVRSSDFPADPDVLPTDAERRDLGIHIFTSQVEHNDMTDVASPAAKAAILSAIDDCLG